MLGHVNESGRVACVGLCTVLETDGRPPLYGEENQSAGTASMPQTFPGSSNSSPSSQRFSRFPREMQLTIRAVTFVFVGSHCNSTVPPTRTA